jgi:SAM-dependent methyltransferase
MRNANASAAADRLSEHDAVELNRMTVAAYEGYARNYALLIGPEPGAERALSLRRLDRLAPAGPVLEVGSGTGRDADYLEDVFGRAVRRTDATEAFRQIQAERGKSVDLLNVLTDSLGGQYAAVVALCVLIHVAHEALPAVLRRIHDALLRSGVMLLSMREGEGAEESGPWYTALWRESDLVPELLDAGFRIETRSWHVDSSGERWLTYLLIRRA